MSFSEIASRASAFLACIAICTPTVIAQPTVSIGTSTSPPAPNLSALSLNEATVAVGKLAIESIVAVSVPPGMTAAKRWEYYDQFSGRGTRSSRAKFHQRRISSGVIVSSDGYILTNHHVIDDVAEDSILVILNNGDTYRAELVGSDPLTDVAVIRVYARNLPAVFVGNSDSVRVGEWVLAVGNPSGLRNTVTAGIVSAIGRATDKEPEDDDHAIENFIQMDAAVNPGNSGGGLFNLRGQLIGLVSALYSYTGYFTGYGLAIPSTLAQVVAEDIVEDGRVDRSRLGVAASDVADTTARRLRMEKAEGAVIDDVEAGSPAASAGLRRHDVVVSIDDVEVSKLSDLQRQLVARRPGQRIQLGVWRGGRRETIAVELGRHAVTRRDTLVKKSDRTARLGIVGEDVTSDLAARNKLGTSRGVYIARIDPHGAASRSGIMHGDVIVSLDDMSIPSTVVLNNELRLRRPGDAVKVTIMREGEELMREVILERGWTGGLWR